MVSGAHDGQPLPETFVNSGKRVAKGNETTTFFGPQVFMRARFTVDRTKEPKEIDYVLTLGPSAGKTQYGIYELEGKTLKLCFSAPGQERPSDFTTTQGDGRTVTVWSLVKK